MHRVFTEAGARCRLPSAAFYLPDLGRGGTRSPRGAVTGTDAARCLLDQHGIGALPGEVFGDDPSALRFRVADEPALRGE